MELAEANEDVAGISGGNDWQLAVINSSASSGGAR